MKILAYTRTHQTDTEDLETREDQQNRIAGYATAKGWQSISLWIHDDEPLESRLIERESRILEKQVLVRGDILVAPRLRDVLIYPLALRRITEEFEAEGIELYFTDIGRVTSDERLHTVLEALSRSDPMMFVTEGQSPFVADDYRGGKPPFGFTRDQYGRLVEDNQFSEKVKMILELNEQGKSLRAISNALGERGIQLSHVGVSRVLKRYESMNQ